MTSSTPTNIRRRHAKRLAEAAFAPPTIHPPPPPSSSPDPPRARSAAATRDDSSKLYTPLLEQSRALAVALQTAAPRIKRACECRADELSMVHAVVAELQAALGPDAPGIPRCAVALLEPGANALAVVAATRPTDTLGLRLERADTKAPASLLFACVDDNRTITSSSSSSSSSTVYDDLEIEPFASPFLCAPLRTDNGGRPVGVLAMDGFCRSALPLRVDPLSVSTEQQHASAAKAPRPEDYDARLEPFLQQRDEACKHIKLWRLRTATSGVVSREARPVAARVVAGRVEAVDRRRGSRYVVFSVAWDDGRCETDISLRAMKELLRATPATLGVGVPLDDVLVEFAEYVASVLGERVVRLRQSKSAAKIRALVTTPKQTITDVYRTALELFSSCVLRARVAEIWAYDDRLALTVVARLEPGRTFRQLRAPRRLFEIPTKHRGLFWDRVHANDSFTMPFADDVVVTPLLSAGDVADDLQHEGLLLTIARTCDDDPRDLVFARHVTDALRGTVSVMRKREIRSKRRAESLLRVCELCAEVNDKSARALREAVTLEVETCLDGANASVGILQAGGDAVDLLGGHEARGDEESTSIFDCLPPTSAPCRVLKDPRGSPPNLTVVAAGTRVEIRYGKLWYPGVVTRDRGHETFDVVYDLRDWMGRHEKEAGVPRRRLRAPKPQDPKPAPKTLLAAARADSNKDNKNNIKREDSLWPLIIVPLGKHCGVLCVDSWAPLNDEPYHDEPHLVVYAQSVARHLGTALERLTRSAAAKYLSGLVLGTSTAWRDDIKAALTNRLQECILFATGVRIHDVTRLTPTAFPAVSKPDAERAVERCLTIAHAYDSSEPTPAFSIGDEGKALVTIFEDCHVVVPNEDVAPQVIRKCFAVVCSYSQRNRFILVLSR